MFLTNAIVTDLAIAPLNPNMIMQSFAFFVWIENYFPGHRLNICHLFFQ